MLGTFFIPARGVIAWGGIVCVVAGHFIYWQGATAATGFLENNVKGAMVAREELLKPTGFSCSFLMEERNRVYHSKAKVEYREKGNLFKIVFDYIETTEFDQPNAPTVLSLTKKKEFSVYNNQYMEMNWFTAQGLIGYADKKQERFIMNSLLPTQFWLDYRDTSLSAAWKLGTAKFHDDNLSLNVVFEYGHLVLFFSPRWNYLVRKAQFFNQDGILLRELIVAQADEIQKGSMVFIPRSFSIELFGPGVDGKAIPINKTTWEMTAIAANHSLTDEDFEIHFPAGAAVANNITGKAYQVGKHPEVFDSGALKTIGKTGDDGPRFHRRTILIIAMALTLIATFSVALLRRRKRKESTETSP